MLDTLREVETPEGVALHLRCAGVVPRALAWLLDLMVRVAGMAAISTVLGLLGGAGVGAGLVLMFLVYWGYPIAFEVLRDGQTPGQARLRPEGGQRQRHAGDLAAFGGAQPAAHGRHAAGAVRLRRRLPACSIAPGGAWATTSPAPW